MIDGSANSSGPTTDALSLGPLDQLVQLRRSGPLVEPYQKPIASETEPPRALKALARIIDGGLCHRCGSCVGICPTDVLAVDREEYPVVKNLSACTDCDLCVRVCPGDELNVKEIAEQLYGEVPDIHDMHGHFEQAYLCHANDAEVRENSTSGGAVTGLLLSLIERKIIDGAIVITSDETELWKGVPTVARTREQLVASMKSKYAISPTNSVFSEVRKIEGRYALVGLPCQIHGYHKAAALDRRIRDRIVLTIGLFCHAAVEHDPMNYVWDKLGDEKKDAVRFISRVGKHPGTPHLLKKDGSLTPVYFPKAKGYRPSSMEILNIFYRLYTPKRCLTCYDSTSEFADIAVGDPWFTPPEGVNFYDGYSFVLARTHRGQQALQDASAAGHLGLREISPEMARTSNVMMGEEKRGRAFRVIGG